MSDIAGKVVVITGASSGIGEATALALAARGARVVLGARRTERLEALVDRIVDAGGEAAYLSTDVKRREDVIALVGLALGRFGKLDVLVNNAGIGPVSLFDDLRVEDWVDMIDVNVKGVLYGIAAALPHMIAQKSGHVVNVASVAGHKVGPGGAVYSATKHAVRVITEGLRQEVKAHNIRTTIISPGAVATELTSTVTDPVVAERMRKTYEVAVSADSFARALVFALSQPEEVDINEILYRPTAQVY